MSCRKASAECAPTAGFRRRRRSARARCMPCWERIHRQPARIVAPPALHQHASTGWFNPSARTAPSRCSGSVNSAALHLTRHASLIIEHRQRHSKRLRPIGGYVWACACSDPLLELLKANAAAVLDSLSSLLRLLQATPHPQSVRIHSRSLPAVSFDRPSAPLGLKS
jgi:hypothetical protein